MPTWARHAHAQAGAGAEARTCVEKGELLELAKARCAGRLPPLFSCIGLRAGICALRGSLLGANGVHTCGLCSKCSHTSTHTDMHKHARTQMDKHTRPPHRVNAWEVRRVMAVWRLRIQFALKLVLLFR